MKRYKQITATALALSLCLALTACSSEDTGRATPDATPDANSGTPATVTPDTTSPTVGYESSSSSTDEVTYESYLEDLTSFTEHFMSLQEPFTAAATAFSSDYENPETVQQFADSLKDMVGKFAEIDKITPTEDLGETHQNFVDSCTTVTGTMEKLIVILEDDFVNGGQEALDEYNVIFTEEYLTTYNEFATNIFAVADEIQGKMGS